MEGFRENRQTLKGESIESPRPLSHRNKGFNRSGIVRFMMKANSTSRSAGMAEWVPNSF